MKRDVAFEGAWFRAEPRSHNWGMQTGDVTVMKRRAVIGSVILALLSAGLLVACGGGGKEEATPTAETGADENPDAAAHGHAHAHAATADRDADARALADAEAADAHAEGNTRASHSPHVRRSAASGIGIN